ncbi:hypothetical protein PRZ48_001591 [Zasmidium cellare]|uniref:Hypervirulence associated protein TUDOR domain-containing protein n=1 Tax=Zasmidium cellare TaxID=395010 RepID=A0ABR0F1N5_ZASCE|nr:hypothetical protein PRZ48_001591 [Zasmidium cellare]
MPPKDKYTDPELRDEVKEELKQSDKGGAPGQWSARKAQMMASEYKKRGGDYTADKSQKDESQQNLSNWGDEEWQTKEGSGHAKKEDGTEKRYLPKKAWEQMSEKEKEETDRKKQEESKEGKQFVENTGKAKESRKKVTKGKQNGEDQGDGEENGDEEEEDDGEPDAAATDDEDEEEFVDDGEADEEDDDAEEDEDEDDAQTGDKRKPKKQQSNGSSKKQKSNTGDSNSKSNGSTIGSKHMDATEPAPKGSADRLPKKGQQVQWKAMPGYVDGEVVEVLTQGKNVDGKSVKASKEDPKIVLKSNKSGKICVHKPDACYFED